MTGIDRPPRGLPKSRNPRLRFDLDGVDDGGTAPGTTERVGAEARPRIWHRRLPEFACAVEAVSLLMPHAEPFVVNSAERAMTELSAPLRPAAAAYIAQERRHHGQHQRFNRQVIGDHRALVLLERLMAKVFSFLGRRSMRFGVAFAAGFETIAFAGARWVEPRIGRLFDGADEEPTRLFLWHLAEEVEHKGVAHDVWAEVDGSRVRYAVAMTVAAVVLACFSLAGTLCLLWRRGRLFSPLAHGRLVLWSVTFLFEALTAMVLSCLPGHHPDDFTDPASLVAWLDHHDRDQTSPVDPAAR